MLYRVSLENEDIKFCTAASDKLPIHGKDHKDKVRVQSCMLRTDNAPALLAQFSTDVIPTQVAPVFIMYRVCHMLVCCLPALWLRCNAT